MNRRRFVEASLAVLAGTTIVRPRRAGAKEADGAGEHAGHGAHAAPAADGGLATALAGCVTAGNACLPHCLELLGKGETELRACAESVHQMLAVCNATAIVASTNSRHRKTMLELCRDVCRDCEKECRKHADHHAVCKACAEACARTVEEIGKQLS
jgi:Cys-rich four helix bundle protein (predicted Tat secretion target)